MIDTSRLTRTEREVIACALDHYRAKLEKVAARHPNHARRNDAQWRAFECQRLEAELDRG